MLKSYCNRLQYGVLEDIGGKLEYSSAEWLLHSDWVFEFSKIMDIGYSVL